MRWRRWTVPLSVVAGVMVAQAIVGAPGAPRADAQEGAGACAPAPAGTGDEAAIDTSVYARATGTLDAVMLFVDFPDASAGDAALTDPRAYADILTPATDWFAASSDGRLDLRIRTVEQWFRMPAASDTYGFERGLTFDTHRDYIRDAVRAADGAVDFAGVDIVYVVPPDNASAISFSPAWTAPPGVGVRADGTELRHAATFGQDLHSWGFKVLDHETGHLLGLPDLYDYEAFDQHRHVGGWDLMGDIAGASPDLLGWHKRLLGWLDASEVACVSEPGVTSIDLAPTSATTGTRLAVVPVRDDRVVGVEYRDGTGLDAAACDTGVLVYEVDQRGATGQGLVRVLDANPGGLPAEPRCTDLDDAALHAGQTWSIAGVVVAVITTGAVAHVRISRAPEPSVRRIAGGSRTATAVAASRADYPRRDSAGAVVLARADGFADALAGTPLAVAADAPILLTDPGVLSPDTAAEIDRVLPAGGTVHVLGGPAAITRSVAGTLRARGYRIDRLAGATRFHTAVRIAGALGNPGTVLLSSGRAFPDAVTAGAAAAAVGGVVLLTDGDRAAPATADYLAAHGDGPRWAIGGPAAQAHPEADPIVGPDRHATARRVARTFFDRPRVVGLARADDFPDSLAGGATLGRLGGPVLLTPGGELSPVVRRHLCGDVDPSARILGFGGKAVLADSTLAAALDAVRERCD